MECLASPRNNARRLDSSIWRLYWDQDAPQGDDRRRKLAHALLEHDLAATRGRELIASARSWDGRWIVWVDVERLKGVKNAMRERPEETLDCLSAAVHQKCLDQGMALPERRLVVRVFNVASLAMPIAQLKAKWIGKMVSVTGTVVQMSLVKPIFQSMTTVCQQCGWRVDRQFGNGKGWVQAACDNPRCKSRRPDEIDVETVRSIDWQQLQICEDKPVALQDEGHVVQRVDVVLMEDLVDTCHLGQRITVVGFLRALCLDAQADTGRKKKDLSFSLYVEALSIVHKEHWIEGAIALSQSSEIPRVQEAHGFSQKEIDFVQTFHRNCTNRRLKSLVHSFCPRVYGNELVKVGILLALMGGTCCLQENFQNPHVDRRGHGGIHVLIIADPGMGKEALLDAAACVAPNAIVLNGRTSSRDAILGSIKKSKLSGDDVSEVGAFCLANNGVCIVDDFDCLQLEQRSAVEALLHHRVAFASGDGLETVVESNMTLIAACSPAEGHYQFSKSLMQNVKIGASLLACFDLVLVMADKPNAHNDKMQSLHMIKLHHTHKSFSRFVSSKRSRCGLDGGPGMKDSQQRTFLEGLKTSSGSEKSSSIPPSLVRTYIAYAVRYIHPKLSSEATEILEAFYLQLRSSPLSPTSPPITSRHLESLIKLSQARAKVELRETVTASDAQDAVSVMKHLLADCFISEVDVPEAQSRAKGRGKTRAIEQFLQGLKQLAVSRQTDLVTMDDAYFVADSQELQVEDIQLLVEQLNDAGDLLKKGPYLYKIAECHNASSADLQLQQPLSGRLTGRGFSTLVQAAEP